METEESLKIRSKKKKFFTKAMYTKSVIVFSAVVLFLIVLLGRIIFLYATKGKDYSNAVLSHLSFQGSAVPYQRGVITDRNGMVLAKSEEVYNVVLDSTVILSNDKNEFIQPTVDALNEVFGLDKDDMLKLIKENPTSKYLVVAKQLPYDQVNKFEALQSSNKFIKGVWFELEYKRAYNYDSLACHVIGYTNAGNVGTYGIEQQYNDYLNGEDGITYGYYDNELNLVKTVIPAKNGATVTSTVDIFIQTVIEDEIKKFKDEYKVNNCSIVVMDPNSGAILGMAANNGYNLNDPRGDSSLLKMYTQEEIDAMTFEQRSAALLRVWRNYTISDSFEPGSTFKLITVSAALEENLVNRDCTYDCNGYRTVGRWHIRCVKREGHGKLTLMGAVDQSCNAALMDIGFLLGKERFLKYQRYFEFGQKTGIDMPGEASGIVLQDKDVDDAALATMTFGQSVNVTMVQMLSAYSSLINGGYYYKPHVVSKVVDNNGITVYAAENTLRKLTVSKATSDYMRENTESVIENGTAYRAHVDGYRVGGKTGTAQKGRREDDKFVVSFISSVPADNPEVAMFIVMDEIEDPEYYNTSKLPLEMTSRTLARILPHLGIYPTEGPIDYKEEEFIEDEVSHGEGPEEGEIPEELLPSEDEEGEEGEEGAETTPTPEVTE